MKHSHTSGPWKVINATFGWKGSQPRICNECEDTKVAELPALSNSSGAVNLRAEEIAANAQLIAAAPELAEALQAILDSFQCFAEGQIGIAFHEMSEVVEAKAALRKAGLLPATES